jgi:hypothetical protein
MQGGVSAEVPTTLAPDENPSSVLVPDLRSLFAQTRSRVGARGHVKLEVAARIE